MQRSILAGRILGIVLLVYALLHSFGATPTCLGNESPGVPPDSSVVFLGRIEGPIGPITKEYIERVIEEASVSRPQCVLLTMDTPGGLDLSMRSIIKTIFSSPVPVAILVYPPGARAASAGAIITLAAHVAAMAPGTNIGAAHPVAIGEGKMDENMAEKITNDAAAYARSIAKKRERNVEWAEKIVRESISNTAEEAKEAGVIDFVTPDVDSLLGAMNGFEVEMDGERRILSTSGASLTKRYPNFRERTLALISEPNIAYILMLLGIFGLFFELQNPGAIFPGVIGGISILLAFFALQVLPVNISGLALIILAIILFILEVKIPSGGALTIGGIVSMLIGSMMFIDSPLPFMRVSIGVIIPAVVFTALFFVFAVGMGIRAQRRKVSTGQGGIIGEVGIAREDIDPEGTVFVHGEYWKAYSDRKIPKGSKVVVLSVEGMVLKVKPHEHKEVG